MHREAKIRTLTWLSGALLIMVTLQKIAVKVSPTGKRATIIRAIKLRNVSIKVTAAIT